MRSFCQKKEKKIIVVVVLDGSSSSSGSASIGTAVVEEQILSHRCGSDALFEDLEFGAFLLSELIRALARLAESKKAHRSASFADNFRKASSLPQT